MAVHRTICNSFLLQALWSSDRGGLLRAPIFRQENFAQPAVKRYCNENFNVNIAKSHSRPFEWPSKVDQETSKRVLIEMYTTH